MTATTAEKPARPVEIAERALAAIARRGDDAVLISVVPAEALMNDAHDLVRRHARVEPLPLYGLSFVVK
ncbi:MAG: amidase, partial [Polyangia bacterium]